MATPDATVDVTADVTPDVARDVAGDVPGDVTPEAPSSEGGVACHMFTGKGTTLQCDYVKSTAACGAGEKPGSCPPKNLVGCCVTSAAGMATAVCYYTQDVPDAAVEQTLCTTAGNTWVTTAP